MSGRTFGMQSSWDDTLKKLTSGLGVDGAQLRQAVGMADSMNQQLEEFINRFVVTANNDNGDITFDAAGTYTFAGDVTVTGALTVTQDNGAFFIQPTGAVRYMTATVSSTEVGWTIQPEQAVSTLGLVAVTTVNADLVNEYHKLQLFTPGYSGLNRAEITLAGEREDSSVDAFTSMGGAGSIVGTTSSGPYFSLSGGVKFQVTSTGAEFNNGTTASALVNMEAGNVALPSYSFNGDADTGMYRSGTNKLSFATNATARMTIDAAGEVGIGDTTPTSQLDVKSPSGTRAFHFHCKGDVGAGDVTGGIMQIGADADSTNPDTGDYWILFRRGNGSTIGSVRGTGSNTVNFATSSDATLKDDNGLVDEVRISGIIDDLRIHDFDWKEGTVSNQIGVFAQEAIDVLPESIVAAPGEDEDGNYLPASLDYSKIVPILVAECQFLRGRVSALEAAASGNRPA